MKHLNLAAFGALTLAAGAFGVHLGQSAISGINPIHFQGAAIHPRDRGAVVPEMLEGHQVSFANGYSWEQGRAARAEDCGGCEALGARDAYAGGGEPVFAVLETGWTNDPTPAAYFTEPAADAAEEAGDAQAAAEAQRAQIDRYAYYPLQSEPQPEAEAVAMADAAPADAGHQQMAMVQE